MILRRLTSSLKDQHWMTIVIELLIVIVGVFVGTQVSNWNQGRLEKRQTQRMLDQLVPELRSQIAFFESAKTYFTANRGYANVALRAWRGDRSIDDSTFVTAAYQATQIYGIGTNAQTWALTLGGQQVREIDDEQLRRNLAAVLTADYAPVAFDAVATPYRERVRHIIPIEVQDRIRASCGDRNVFSGLAQNVVVLPPTCGLKLTAAEAGPIAAKLRANPQLPDELNWQLAEIATYIENAIVLELQMQNLLADLRKRA